MNLVERIRAASRVFKLGEAAFNQHEMHFGHDDATYSPAEYGKYLTTSNAVYTCSKLRAEQLAGFPPRGYYFDEDGKKREVAGHKSLQILRRVNEFWTLNRLMRMTELCLSIWGRGYWVIEREGPDNKGEPVEIWWVRSDRMKVYPHSTKYISAFEYDPMDGGDPILFKPHEVVWFRYPNPMDEYGGLSPIAAARLAADLRSSAAQSNKKLFDHVCGVGCCPCVIQVNIDQLSSNWPLCISTADCAGILSCRGHFNFIGFNHGHFLFHTLSAVLLIRSSVPVVSIPFL